MHCTLFVNVDVFRLLVSADSDSVIYTLSRFEGDNALSIAIHFTFFANEGVIDKPHQLVFMVNLLNKDNLCSCHRPHWEKTPCIHIIRVLHYKEEHWRVWEYVGKEYSLEKATKTTGELNEKEMGLLNDMLTQRSIESEGSMIWRNASKGNGQNKKRFKSRGEFNDPVKNTKKEV